MSVGPTLDDVECLGELWTIILYPRRLTHLPLLDRTCGDVIASASMIDWPHVAADSIWRAVAAVLAAIVLLFAARALAARWERRRRWSRGRIAESIAPGVLEESGYEVLAAQAPGKYTLTVDGQAMNVALRADFIVARHGLQYVAEVKSGRSAPQLSTATTRRQLLEYLVAFPVDGILLVDAESRTIHEVQFPLPFRSVSPAAYGSIGWLVALIVLAAGVVVWFWV